LVVAALSVVIYMRIDQIMLGALSTRAENGLYAVATSLSEVSYFIPVAVMTSLGPVLTGLHERDPDAFLLRLQQVFSLLAAGAYVAMIGSVVVARPLIGVLFGDRYAGTVLPFVILTVSIPFVFLGTAQNIWTILEGHQVLALVRACAGSVLNVGLNFLLLPRFGAVGAAITTVVANVTTSYAGNALSPTTWPILRLQSRALLLLDLRRSGSWVRSLLR
jgi:polysaccharide transporter, PST family